jgi:cobalt-zinc-cadmium resistance protein CzcA
VVIGGLISATVLTLVLLPVLYDRATGWSLRAKRSRLARRVLHA